MLQTAERLGIAASARILCLTTEDVMRDMQLQDWTLTNDELDFLAKQREDIRFELAVGIRCLRVTGFYPRSYGAIDPETL